MGTSAQDGKTQKAASAGAQQGDQTLYGDANDNEKFGTASRDTLFGSNGTGGTLSGMLNPASMNVGGPTGAFATQYQNEANQNANQTQQGLATSRQQSAARGAGASPSGFSQDQSRKAYQGQADTNANLYSSNAMASQQQAVSNFWNATNLLNSAGQNALNQAGSETQAAASNYANLYGTASQQKQNAVGATLGLAAGLAGAGATAYAGKP